jgi:hypothetical protein
MRGKSYTQQEKYAAVTWARALGSIEMASKETGIPERTIRRWREQEKRSGIQFEPGVKKGAQQKEAPAKSWPEKNIPSWPDNSAAESDPAPDDQPLTAATLLPRLRTVHTSIMASIERLASGFDPDDPDINHRAIALTRLLDRVFVLNDHISKLDSKFGSRTYRIEYRYPDGAIHKYPPWMSEETRKRKVRPLEFRDDPETGESWAIIDPDDPPPPGDTRHNWKWDDSPADTYE